MHNVDNQNEYVPPLGSLLGDMTDEMKSYGEGTFIKTFISGGPKFYGFRAVTPSSNNVIESCKVKGISLNFINSLKINFDSIKNIIEQTFQSREENVNDDNSTEIKLAYEAIRRTRTHDIVTRNETKTCCVVLKKRRHLSHEVSLPFGYKH